MGQEGGPAQPSGGGGYSETKGRATKVSKVGRSLTYICIREYQTRTATLNSMRCLRGSQWRTSRM